MRGHFILTLALLLSLGAFAQKGTIKGSVKGMEDGAFIFLKLEGNRLVMLDTIYPDKKGKFEYSMQIGEASTFILQPNKPNSGGVYVMILPGEKIEMEMEWLPLYNMAKLSHAKGSRNMELFARFHAIITESLDRQRELQETYSHPDSSDAARKRAEGIFQEMLMERDAKVSNLLESQSSCLMAALLVTYFEDFEHNIPLYEKVRDALKPMYPDNPLVVSIDKRLATVLTTGSRAPEIDMLDTEGRHRKLSDLQGKIVMIDFWASWCRPCRMENPHVVSLYKKYHEAGFEIYSVSLDKEKSQWLEAIKRDGLIWENHVSDLNGWTSSGGASYGINSVPSTVLVDRDGRIIARNLRGADLNRKLKEIFGF